MYTTNRRLVRKSQLEVRHCVVTELPPPAPCAPPAVQKLQPSDTLSLDVVAGRKVRKLWLSRIVVSCVGPMLFVVKITLIVDVERGEVADVECSF